MTYPRVKLGNVNVGRGEAPVVANTTVRFGAKRFKFATTVAGVLDQLPLRPNGAASVTIVALLLKRK